MKIDHQFAKDFVENNTFIRVSKNIFSRIINKFVELYSEWKARDIDSIYEVEGELVECPRFMIGNTSSNHSSV